MHYVVKRAGRNVPLANAPIIPKRTYKIAPYLPLDSLLAERDADKITVHSLVGEHRKKIGQLHTSKIDVIMAKNDRFAASWFFHCIPLIFHKLRRKDCLPLL